MVQPFKTWNRSILNNNVTGTKSYSYFDQEKSKYFSGDIFITIIVLRYVDSNKDICIITDKILKAHLKTTLTFFNDSLKQKLNYRYCLNFNVDHWSIRRGHIYYIAMYCLTWTSQGKRNETPHDQDVNWEGCVSDRFIFRGTLSWIQTKPGVFPQGDPNACFLVEFRWHRVASWKRLYQRQVNKKQDMFVKHFLI